MVPECRQAECVSGAVGEIEPAVQRVRFVLRVLQSREAGTQDTTRRQTVVDLYEKGQPSAATKRSSDLGTEQSSPGSGISN